MKLITITTGIALVASLVSAHTSTTDCETEFENTQTDTIKVFGVALPDGMSVQVGDLPNGYADGVMTFTGTINGIAHTGNGTAQQIFTGFKKLHPEAALSVETNMTATLEARAAQNKVGERLLQFFARILTCPIDSTTKLLCSPSRTRTKRLGMGQRSLDQRWHQLPQQSARNLPRRSSKLRSYFLLLERCYSALQRCKSPITPHQ